jgi:hypothetical protein
MRSLLLLLFFPASAVLAQGVQDDGIQITIEKVGLVSVVDASFSVPASPRQTWAVLADWDNLTRFMTAFKAIEVVSRSDDAVRMRQTVQARLWPFSFEINLEQELRLFPYARMQSRLLGGDFDMLEGTIRLVADPAGTRIVSHTEFVPRFWLPPLIGPMIMERKMRNQFRNVIDEVARRTAAGAALPDDDGER